VAFVLSLGGLVSALVFYLPWFVPLARPVKSDSYTFGFNNTVAAVGVGLGLLVLFVWHLLRHRSEATRERQQRFLSFFADLPAAPPAEDEPRARWYAAPLPWFALAAALVVLLWWWYIPFPYFGETTSFLSRLDLMALGQRPDTDFQFNYGALMLWAPYSLTWLTSGAVTLEQAYVAFLVFSFALGFYLLDFLARVFSRDLLFRWVVFALFGLPLIKLTLGLNYTPLRFLLAPACLVLVHHRFCGPRGTLRSVFNALLTAVLTFLCVAFSPEMGIALCAAVIAYSAHAFVSARRGSYLWVAAIMGLLTQVAATQGGALDAVVSFGSGGNNFPVFPTMPVLLMLACALTLLPGMAAASVLRSRDPHASLLAGLVVLAGVLVVPALGRADGGHVTLNTMIILIAALAATYKRQRRLFVVFSLLLVAVLGVMDWIAFVSHYDKQILWAARTRALFAKDLSRNGATWERRWAALRKEHNTPATLSWSKPCPFSPDLPRLAGLKQVGIPLGAPSDVRRYLLITGKLAPEYYPYPSPEMFTEGDSARKAADVARMRHILVPAGFRRYLARADREDQARVTSEFLSHLLLYPVDMKVKNDAYEPARAAVELISSRFKPVGRLRNLVLMERVQ